jgi:RNA-directed DNA polymerase
MAVERRDGRKVEGVSDAAKETTAAEVRPETGAKRAAEIRSRWAWVEPAVWSERMLTALEQGVKGGKWFSLIDKVYAMPNLRAAFTKVRANAGAAGADRQTIEMFEEHLEANLEKLSLELSDGSYRPRPVRRQWIPKSGGKAGERRPLGIPTVRDRVAQAAVRSVLEPIFEREFAEHSYGFRPGRGCKAALGRVSELLKRGYTWVVDADLRSYFDTIPHRPLMGQVRQKVSDGRLLELLQGYLEQPILDGMEQWTPEGGTPQGAVLSPLLSNIYLDPLDHQMAAEGHEMVRYADDFVIVCRNEREAEEALAKVRQWVTKAGLELHPEKTRIADANGDKGFEFLGYHFKRGMRFPRAKSIAKMRETIRSKTRRTAGTSLTTIIDNVNRTMRGWYEYFQHAHRNSFPGIDGWVRMRLRSILRKRRGCEGRGRGSDHQRWPNAYFTQLGLFSLTAARAQRVLVLSKVNH